MSIGRKILLLNLAMVLVLVGVTFGVGHHVATDGYLRLEEERVLNETSRAADNWDEEAKTLLGVTRDWAAWNGMYRALAESKADAFFKSNLSLAQMLNLKIDIALLLDPEGKVIILQGLGAERENLRPELERQARRIAATLPQQLARENALAGLVLSDDVPLLLAAQRISSTDYRGPSQGVLVFGRIVDARYMKEMTRRIQVQMNFRKGEKEASSGYWQRIVTPNEVRGYRSLVDLFGEESILLETTLPRTIMQRVEEMIFRYSLMTLLLGTAASMLTFWLSRSLVVRRLEKLDQFMRKVAAQEDGISLQLDLVGHDEVSRTAQTMNLMLSQLQSSREKLKEMSLRDGLTGLYNRSFFQQELERLEVSDVERIDIVVCDVDGLKIVNDTLGHDVGDEMIQQAVRLLLSVFGEKAKVIRMGGDEFLIMLYGESEEHVRNACHRIQEQLELVKLKRDGFILRMSVGWAFSDTPPIRAHHVATMIREADDAMYRRKLAASSENRRIMLESILKMLDSRDYLNEGHGERVGALAYRLGELADASSEQKERLLLLGKVHDIGKVGVADEIVFKSGRLTAAERSEMERHAEIGYRIAQAIPNLAAVADLVLKHHEWWNGNGYPLSLRGMEIPFEARVLAVVDAYDEMTTDRPYRSALPVKKALAELERMAGRQFDPELTALFVKMIRKEIG
ncbi:HD domain-containing phosphohydrolase [Azotosporobacter soli]|uniref:HD domain-containing phosphohydrolase n=1 Tax=Azotosporobacter soli TaxID=3055040 RepID=UPI0031FE9446